jgi:hypothetical protein
MEAAYTLNGNKPARIRDWRRLIGGRGRLAVQSIMRPGDVIILLNEFLQQSCQELFIENEHMVQELSPLNSQMPFDEWIGQRRQQHPIVTKERQS